MMDKMYVCKNGWIRRCDIYVYMYVCVCVYTHSHMEYYTAIKKNKIMPFEATLVQLRLSY